MLGIDPGFRTGCKVAVVDPTGKLLDTATIYPHAPQRRGRTRCDAGRRWSSGTASRSSPSATAPPRARPSSWPPTSSSASAGGRLRYLMVSEAGASVYSASPLARAELPDLDVSLRGAVSIARRVQDPLAELVKIDPQSIGVGLYQHDVDQPRLAEALGGVVESVVNQVGVDVNTASPALLTHVAGIGPKLAERIVAHRDTNGPFPNRASAAQGARAWGRKRSSRRPASCACATATSRWTPAPSIPESYAVAAARAEAGRASIWRRRPPSARRRSTPAGAAARWPRWPPSWAPARRR